MKFNYNKLKGRIIEILGSYTRFAEELGISYQSLNYKFNCKRMFTQDQIVKAIKILNIDIEDVGIYFFNQNVEKNNHICVNE